MGGMIMKKLIFSTLLTFPSLLMAQPSSQIAWTAEQLNFVKAASPQKGQSLSESCSGCHGERGISTSQAFPSLAGQLPTYIYKQLQDYSAGQRQNSMMTPIAKSLSQQDAADLAAWFGAQTPAFQSANPIAYEQAEKLVKNGDNQRILPPCEVCHGGNGQGQTVDIPALATQNATYLQATLQAFKQGTRSNDIYSRMRLIAKQLTESEIKELGLYYQNSKQ